jgi:iron-sulfur cluster assembly accessory protein
MVELSLNLNQTPVEFNFVIDDAAANHINKLKQFENKTNHALRIKVVPGGCAGFMYEFSWLSLDEVKDEEIIENGYAKIAFGQADKRHINEGTLTFIESLAGSKFEIINPNASTACGCGKSFA